MLVLKVHRGEIVTIGEAYVKVTRISEEWAELGIEAPPDWAIDRDTNHIQDGPEDARKTICSPGNDRLLPD